MRKALNIDCMYSYQTQHSRSRDGIYDQNELLSNWVFSEDLENHLTAVSIERMQPAIPFSLYYEVLLSALVSKERSSYGLNVFITYCSGITRVSWQCQRYNHLPRSCPLYVIEIETPVITWNRRECHMLSKTL